MSVSEHCSSWVGWVGVVPRTTTGDTAFVCESNKKMDLLKYGTDRNALQGEGGGEIPGFPVLCVATGGAAGEAVFSLARLAFRGRRFSCVALRWFGMGYPILPVLLRSDYWRLHITQSSKLYKSVLPVTLLPLRIQLQKRELASFCFLHLGWAPCHSLVSRVPI